MFLGETKASKHFWFDAEWRPKISETTTSLDGSSFGFVLMKAYKK